MHLRLGLRLGFSTFTSSSFTDPLLALPPPPPLSPPANHFHESLRFIECPRDQVARPVSLFDGTLRYRSCARFQGNVAVRAGGGASGTGSRGERRAAWIQPPTT